MRTGGIAVRAGSALALASLALTVDNLRRLRRPAARPDPVAEPVALLLPVRDEERHVEPAVRGLLAAAARWSGPVRVVVLDDGSTDATPAILQRLAAEPGGPEVVAGGPTPRGWLGKPWACHQLAGVVADAAVLVFVDADVDLAPDALVATVDLLRSAGLDLVSPYPRQEAHGWAERLVQPLLQWSWASTLPLGLAERSPRPSLAAANGQLLAVDAVTYRRAGGHTAVRGEVLEDLALLRAVKAVGGRGGVVDGSRIATCRMYRGGRELRAGYAKSLWSAFGGTGGAVGVVALLGLAHVVPAVGALAGSRVGLVGYAAGVTSRVLVARRTGGRAFPDAAAHPLSVVCFGALVADSVLARRRGRLRWKGRPVEVAEAVP